MAKNNFYHKSILYDTLFQCGRKELDPNEFGYFNYHVIEKNHKFIKQNGLFFRTNEIWRTKNAKYRSGESIEKELHYKKFGQAKYRPNEYQLEK